eukprot:Rhum_TRINITY_DN14488_c7_g2::Rhum_TRINITY_DN14488_c7_g2_i1::g.92606::m.92606
MVETSCTTVKVKEGLRECVFFFCFISGRVVVLLLLSHCVVAHAPRRLDAQDSGFYGEGGVLEKADLAARSMQRQRAGKVPRRRRRVRAGRRSEARRGVRRVRRRPGRRHAARTRRARREGTRLVAQRRLLHLQVVALLAQPHLLVDQRRLLDLHLRARRKVVDVLLLQRAAHGLLRLHRPRRLRLDAALRRLALAADEQLLLLTLPLHLLVRARLAGAQVRRRAVALAVLRPRQVRLRQPQALARHVHVLRRLRRDQRRLLLHAGRRRHVGPRPHGVRPLRLHLPLLLQQQPLDLPQTLLGVRLLRLLHAETRLGRLHLPLRVLVLQLLRTLDVARRGLLRAPRGDLCARALRLRTRAVEHGERLTLARLRLGDGLRLRGEAALLRGRLRRRLRRRGARVGLAGTEGVEEAAGGLDALLLAHVLPVLAGTVVHGVEEGRVALGEALELGVADGAVPVGVGLHEEVRHGGDAELELEVRQEGLELVDVDGADLLGVHLVEHHRHLLLVRRVGARPQQHGVVHRRERHRRRDGGGGRRGRSRGRLQGGDAAGVLGLRRGGGGDVGRSGRVGGVRGVGSVGGGGGGGVRVGRSVGVGGGLHGGGGGGGASDGANGGGRGADSRGQLRLNLLVPRRLRLEDVDLAEVLHLGAAEQVDPELNPLVEDLHAVDAEARRVAGGRTRRVLGSEDSLHPAVQVGDGRLSEELDLVVGLGAVQVRRDEQCKHHCSGTKGEGGKEGQY